MDAQVQQLASQAMLLPMAERAGLIQTLLKTLQGRSAEASNAAPQAPDLLLGQFSEDADLLDEIVQEALQARVDQPLRLADG